MVALQWLQPTCWIYYVMYDVPKDGPDHATALSLGPSITGEEAGNLHHLRQTRFSRPGVSTELVELRHGQSTKEISSGLLLGRLQVLQQDPKRKETV
jgi:hypothetical protein